MQEASCQLVLPAPSQRVQPTFLFKTPIKMILRALQKYKTGINIHTYMQLYVIL